MAKGCEIKIQDKPIVDLSDSLIEVEVDDDHRQAACVCRIKFAITRQPDGLWTVLDDEGLKLWNKIRISVNVADEKVEIFNGYITQIKPHIDRDESKSYIEILGMDGTSLMSLEEKIKDWPNITDSDIAAEIFKNPDYNLKPEVEKISVVHDEAVATIIQRETDIQFLKRLARRNGFECFVKGEKGYFRKPALTGKPMPVLAAFFGKQTSLTSFDARLNAMRPTAVEMHQIDTIRKEIMDAVVESGKQRKLGRDDVLSVKAPNNITSRFHVKHAVATGQEEMENLCRAVYDEAEWFIEASGEIDTKVYGSVLEVRKLVPVKGVGEIFSGIYYVTKVKHVLKMNQYIQHFVARRNAMAPSGPADFGGSDSLLGGLI